MCSIPLTKVILSCPPDNSESEPSFTKNKTKQTNVVQFSVKSHENIHDHLHASREMDRLKIS